ncbi:helix-turn-helix domain-containing protein [Mycobacterium sherrisii]|uniref:helix-turn-helix domain-containing protein n=1 Tax=Mycobacterium sherrisii TaxID=243061 RepID=UPI0012F51F86|nr:helix-turn-helix domain-containing protein [Mycobacterium sherrisii]
MTAVVRVPGDDVAPAAIRAAVARVDVVQLAPDLARVIAHWLSQYAALAARRSGCRPGGVVEMGLALAEAVVADRPGRELVIGVSVARVDVVQLSLDAARRIIAWLGRLVELAGEFNSVAVEAVRRVQYVLAEACAAAQSRNRDELPDVGATPIALSHDENGGVLTVAQAASLLGVKQDTVRKWCRGGELIAERHGSRWFPKVAAVQALQRTRGK